MKTKFNGLLIVIIGVMTLISGLLVFIGWQMDNNLLQTFAGGSEPMKLSSNISFLLLALALILQQSDDFRIGIMLSRLITVLIASVGLVVLSHYIIGLNYGMPVSDTSTLWPVHMAPNTAFSFLLLAIVLFARSFRKMDKSPVILILYIIALIVSIICLVGYANGMIELTGLAGSFKMPMNTAILFIAICIGIYSKSLKRTYDYTNSSQNPV